MRAFTSMLPYRKLDVSNLVLIGHGTERYGYYDPKRPHVLIKCAPFDQARQSLREIAYYELLKRRGVPFTHLARLFGAFRSDEFVVMIMERLANVKENRSFTYWHLPVALEEGMVDVTLLQQAFDRYKAYLLKYNILTTDMICFNFMMKVYQRSECSNPFRYELVFFDGVASPQLIPFNAMIKPLGRKRIEKHCKQFVDTVRETSHGRILLTI